MYFLLIDVLSSSIHKLESLTLSKAFVKSMNVIWTGLLNSMDFSMICSRANICSIVPLPGWYWYNLIHGIKCLFQVEKKSKVSFVVVDI